MKKKSAVVPVISEVKVEGLVKSVDVGDVSAGGRSGDGFTLRVDDSGVHISGRSGAFHELVYLTMSLGKWDAVVEGVRLLRADTRRIPE